MDIRYTIILKGQSTQTGLLSLPSSWADVKMTRGVRMAIVALDDDALAFEIIRSCLGTNIDMLSDENLADLIRQVQQHVSLSDVPSSDYFDKGTLQQLQDIEEFFKTYGPDADWQHIRQVLHPLIGKWPYITPRSEIVLYGLATLQDIHRRYATTLFRKSEDSDDGGHFGWFGIALQIAKSGVFGDINGVLSRRFHDVAIHLIEEQREADKIADMRRQSSLRSGQYSH